MLHGPAARKADLLLLTPMEKWENTLEVLVEEGEEHLPSVLRNPPLAPPGALCPAPGCAHTELSWQPCQENLG